MTARVDTIDKIERKLLCKTDINCSQCHLDKWCFFFLSDFEHYFDLSFCEEIETMIYLEGE